MRLDSVSRSGIPLSVQNCKKWTPSRFLSKVWSSSFVIGKSSQHVEKPINVFCMLFHQVATAVNGATDNSLVIIDEFGKGTATVLSLKQRYKQRDTKYCFTSGCWQCPQRCMFFLCSLFRSMACPYWLLHCVTGLERGPTVQTFWCLRTSMALSNKTCSLKLLWLHIRYWSQERLSKFPISNEQLTKMWSVLKKYTTRAASWHAQSRSINIGVAAWPSG